MRRDTVSKNTAPPALRAEILETFRHRCGYCGRARKLDLDHVIKRPLQGSTTTKSNLVPLCRVCHARKDYPLAQGRLVIRYRPDLPGAVHGFVYDLVYTLERWEELTA